MKNVLVVGSVNVDYVIHTERLPKLGETLNGSNFQMNFGGKGANQAAAMAKLGCSVKMLGAVGSDQAGKLALENLQNYGVDTSEMFCTDAPTGAAVITVCRGDNHILLDMGANATLTPDLTAQKESLFAWADAVVLQYEIPAETVLFAAKLAKKYGKTVVVNPAPVKEMNPALYPLVDVLIPNEFEAGLLTGVEVKDEESTKAALRRLYEFGAANPIITLGSRGSMFKTATGEILQGVFPAKVVDTTAAGDSFVGGVTAKLCEGKDLAEAVRYASAVSAIAVSRYGAMASVPTENEVDEFLKNHTEEA